MFDTKAFSICSTRIGYRARIDTFVVEALFVVRAVVICRAFQFKAAVLWIAGIARLTEAHWMMVLNVTFSISAATAWTRTQTVYA